MNVKRSLYFLLLSVIIGIAAYWGVSKVMNHRNMKITYYNKLYKTQNSDVVFIGDSRCFFNFNYSKLEHLFPRLKIANLGFESINLSEDYLNFVSENLSNNGTVVISVNMANFTKQNKRHMSDVYREYQYGILSYISYSLPKLSEGIRLLNTFKFKEIESPSETYSCVYVNYFNENELDDEHRRHFCSGVDYDKIMILTNWIKKTVLKGQAVYFVRSPVSKSIINIEKECDFISYNTLADKLRNSGAHELEIKDSYHTYDGSHLDCSEANKFSDEVTELLKTKLTSH